jgi:hypothetical protein
MSTARSFAGTAINSFFNESLELVKISGGFDGETSLNTGETRTNYGWIPINSTIPTKVFTHCMSYVNQVNQFHQQFMRFFSLLLCLFIFKHTIVQILVIFITEHCYFDWWSTRG